MLWVPIKDLKVQLEKCLELNAQKIVFPTIKEMSLDHKLILMIVQFVKQVFMLDLSKMRKEEYS